MGEMRGQLRSALWLVGRLRSLQNIQVIQGQLGHTTVRVKFRVRIRVQAWSGVTVWPFWPCVSVSLAVTCHSKHFTHLSDQTPNMPSVVVQTVARCHRVSLLLTSFMWITFLYKWNWKVISTYNVYIVRRYHLPWWLRWLRHSAHQLGRSVGGAGVQFLRRPVDFVFRFQRRML